MLHATDHRLSLRSVYRASPWGEPFHWNEAGWHNPESVILVHGFAAHAMTFRRVVARLAEHYHVIVPDLPAHGRDETFRAPALEPHFDLMVGWLEAFLDVLDVDLFHLLGHSLGGTMAYYVAADEARNDRSNLLSLTLVAPGLRLRPMPLSSVLVSNLPAVLPRMVTNRIGFTVYEPINWFGKKMGELEKESYLHPLRQRDRLRFMLDLGGDILRTPDRRQKLRPLEIPTLLMWGARDHVVPVSDARGLQGLLGAPPLEIIDGSGHSPMEDRPDEFAASYLEFLEGL